MNSEEISAQKNKLLNSIPTLCYRCMVFHEAYHVFNATFDCPPERLMAVQMTSMRCVTQQVNGGHHTFVRLAE